MVKLIEILMLIFMTFSLAFVDSKVLFAGIFPEPSVEEDITLEQVSESKRREVQKIFSRVEMVRELSGSIPENIMHISVSDAKKDLRSQLTELDNDELRLQAEVLKNFGLIEDFTFQDRVEALSSQVSGYYNSVNDSMVLVESLAKASEQFSYLEEITVAHELVHALQHKNFDLNRFVDIIPFSVKDYDIALLSAIEGDATFFMQKYAEENPPQSLGDFFSKDMTEMDLPPIFEKTLTAPYFSGLEFTRYLYKEGGAELVNESIIRPPETTEQVLHPQKYITGEGPLEIDFTPEEYEFELSLGEIGLRHFFDLAQVGSANSCAAGWGNDIIFLNDKTNTLVTRWDTRADLKEAEKCFEESFDEAEDWGIDVKLVDVSVDLLVVEFSRN
jgi:hypothetical protein